jgi:hypothetical protein
MIPAFRSRPFLATVAFTAFVAFVACSKTDTPAPPKVPQASGSTKMVADAVQKLVRTADPGTAEDIKAAKQAGARDTVTVTGRIYEIVPGKAAFRIMDLSVAYCGEKKKENCPTPWDYCCESATTRNASSVLVEARGADGAPIATDALPDMRLLDVVKVTGKLVADEHGNHTVVATGLFRGARPNLPADLDWPK